MDKVKLMQKEIEDKRKLPEEIKKDIKKSILHNLLIAIIIILYLCTINILFYKLENNVFEKQMKFFALGIICVTVIVFEVAYRKQSKRTCIIGIELLLCSIISLYIPYIYLFANVNLKMLTIILPLSIAGYYIIKAILIYNTGKIKHHNNLSDVKEILKDTEKLGYLDEDSKKSYREFKVQDEKNKQELLVEQRKKTEANKKKNSSTKKDTSKKNTTKQVKKEISKTSKKTNTKTKVNTEIKLKVEEKTESKPKRRTTKKEK